MLNFPNQEQFEELKIGTINITSETKNWLNFSKWVNLKLFSIESIIHQGSYEMMNIPVTLPESVTIC